MLTADAAPMSRSIPAANICGCRSNIAATGPIPSLRRTEPKILPAGSRVSPCALRLSGQYDRLSPRNSMRAWRTRHHANAVFDDAGSEGKGRFPRQDSR